MTVTGPGPGNLGGRQETSATDTTDPGAGREATRDVGPRQHYETTEPAGQTEDEHADTDAEAEARIADQDELSTRQESRQATWGDNPDYYDQAELDAEHDSDVDASLTEEDELPARQKSRAHTWGDNPDYDEETDLASEYDGDLDALTAQEDQLPARQESRAATWGDNPEYDDSDQIEDGDHVATLATDLDGTVAQDTEASPDTEDTHAESAIPPKDGVESRALDVSIGPLDQDIVTTDDDDQPDQVRTDMASTESGRSREGQATADSGTEKEPPDLGSASVAADTGTATDHGGRDTQSDHPDEGGPPPDPPDTSESDNRADVSPEAERLAELQAQLAEVKAELAQTKAELDETKGKLNQAHQEMADLKTRVHQHDAPVEDTESPPEDADPDPADHTAEESDASRDPDAKSPTIAERKGTGQEADTSDEVRAWWRRAPASEDIGAIGLVIGAAGGALTGLPAIEAVAAATVIGAVSYAKAKIEKHRKGKL